MELPDVTQLTEQQLDQLVAAIQQAIVDGVDVMSLHGKSLRRFRRHIGMIFQSFNLVTRSTVIKNVLTSMVPDMGFFKVLFGIFSRQQELAALAALDKVGILDKAYTR